MVAVGLAITAKEATVKYEAPAIERLGNVTELTQFFNWLKDCLPGGSATDPTYQPT